MPHVNSGGGDDLASTDEVKVYKDEGEDEKRSSEHLDEDKLGLVTETEEGKSSPIDGQSYSEKERRGGGGPQDGKHQDHPLPDRPGPLPGYVVTPYPYPNGATLPGTLGPPHPGALASLMMYNNDHFSQPPPAHMGIPPVNIDPKTGTNAVLLGHLSSLGLPRPPMYIPPPPGQFPPQLYPEFSQMQWNSTSGYPITASGFRGQYPSSLVTSSLSRFSPPGLMHPHPGLPHPGLPHHAIITPGPKQEIPHPPHSQENHRHPSLHDQRTNGNPNEHEDPPEKKKPYVKKPLNAFMLFMKEMRAKVISEGTLKESAAINQYLGRKWHALDRSEQSKYYDMARKEKELHMQLYPGWSARDNYATHTKKKKRKREPGENREFFTAGTAQGSHQSPCYFAECNNPKKCRARFGVDQQNQWCKPCRRKKKCIRFLQDGDGGASNTEGEDEDLSVHTFDSDIDSEPDSPSRSNKNSEGAPIISSRMEDSLKTGGPSSSSSSSASAVLNVPLPSSAALSSLAQSHHQGALSVRQNSSSPVANSSSINNTLTSSSSTATPMAT